ncbi:MAG: transporter [Acidobacteria bacterium]|nr:MAG: transporter [Acidobacteriota bacterium]
MPTRIGGVVLLLVACLSAVAVDEALAQGPPIHTDTPIMLGLAGRGVRSFGKVVHRGKLFADGEAIDNPDGREVTIVQFPVVVPYNLFSERFQVGFIAPLVRINAHMPEGEASSSGLADIRVFGKYLLYQRDRLNETLRVATKAGVKFPSGSTSITPPLGSGSTDYFASAVVGWIRGRTGIYAEGIYNVNTSNNDVDFGNGFGYNLALGFRLSPAVYDIYPSRQLNLFIEMNGSTVRRSKRSGASLENSGGTVIFLSPGLQFVGGRRWLVEASVQLPVVNAPNGTQLGTSWTTLAGIRVLLF